MRILVTGSTGFIGSHIVEQLQAGGHNVRAIDRRPAKLRSPATKVEELIGELTDRHLLDAALVDIDLVCHQAAKVGLGVDLADLPGYATDNDLATAELLSAMGRHAVDRLVLASSMVVYGEGRYDCTTHGHVAAPPRRPADLAAGLYEPRCPVCESPLTPKLVDETSVLDPRNAYAATKVAQEHLSAAWARQCGGRVIALRYHNVYGPRMPQNTPYAGVASIFRSAIARGEAPQVFEDGGQRRNFVHVQDVAAANQTAAELIDSPLIGDGELRAYNVASGQVRTVHDLAVALSSALQGQEPIVTGEFRLGDVRHITASADRFTSELGWRAKIQFAEGMRELAHAD